MTLRSIGGSRLEVKSELSGPTKDKPSLTATLVASSATFAVFTAFLYFIAGAFYEGRAGVLGTEYLTLPPANSFVYMGAEFMLGTGLVVVCIASVVWFAGSFVAYCEVRFPRLFKRAAAEIMRLTRFWELVVSAAILVAAIVCLGTTASLLNEPAHVVTDHVCMPISKPTQYHQGVLLVATVLFTATVPSRFRSRRARWAGWVIGGFIALCFMFGFAWDTGRHNLFSATIPQAKIKLTAPSSAEFDALVLGSDDKDLVIVTHNRVGRFEPEYLSRSQVLGFRLIGSATLQKFICGTPPQSSRHQ